MNEAQQLFVADETDNLAGLGYKLLSTTRLQDRD
jgi:hypothetical protein